MKLNRLALAPLAPALLVALAGCGGPDRVSLAKSTVHDYWYDVGHLQTAKSYQLLSPGVQGTISRRQYRQSIVSFLEHTAGVTAVVRKADVLGDCALVYIGLISPRAPSGQFKAHQHLYWINGGWRITDQLATISQQPEKLTSCPTGG